MKAHSEKVEQLSTKIFYCRMLYGLWVVFQLPIYGMKLTRVTNYLLFAFSQQAFIWATRNAQWLQLYHSSFAILSFCSFVMNDPKVYHDGTDHIGLMIGFIAICHLSSMFLSVSWMYSAIGLTFSISVVSYYFVAQLEYRLNSLFIGLIMTLSSCSYISYYTELKEKELFLRL